MVGGRKRPKRYKGEQHLFELPPAGPVRVRPGDFGIWTAQKALVIDEYLRQFVFITKGGTYIDGFAGPKEPHRPETWSAKRVVDRHGDPTKRRINRYYLVDNKTAQFEHLKRLRADNPGRNIRVYHADFNVVVDEILERNRPREPTFCLLDQFTRECDWATVVKLASRKKHRYKIELFYFFAVGWIHRPLASAKDENLDRWWGGRGWTELRGKTKFQRGQLFAQRFVDELDYRYATPWPVRDRYRKGAEIKFYMIHATDHDRAPHLMKSANDGTVGKAIKRGEITPLF